MYNRAKHWNDRQLKVLWVGADMHLPQLAQLDGSGVCLGLDALKASSREQGRAPSVMA